MDKNLLLDWCDFCEGKKNFDTFHFSYLFNQPLTECELKKIFSYFPKKEELLELVLSVRASSISAGEDGGFFIPKKESKGTPEELIELAVKDLKEQQKICSLLGDEELYNIIDNAQPEFIYDKNYFRKVKSGDCPYIWLYEMVGDYIRDSLIEHDDKIYALREALYGFGGDYYLSWYLGSPLVDANINLSYYFDLWKKGGDYTLTKDNLIVTYSWAID